MVVRNRLLSRENDLFTSYLRRRDALDERFAAEEEAKALMGLGAKRKRGATVTTLSIAVKIGIATEELNELSDLSAKLRQDAQKNQEEKYVCLCLHRCACFLCHAIVYLCTFRLFFIQALLEDCTHRVQELNKESYAFKRDVMVAGQMDKTGVIDAEVVRHHFEDDTRNKVCVSECMGVH